MNGVVDVGCMLVVQGTPALSKVQMVVAGVADTVTLPGPAIPQGNVVPYTERWPTDSVSNGAHVFPNGVYTVWMRLRFVDNTTSTSVNRVTMTVNNK